MQLINGSTVTLKVKNTMYPSRNQYASNLFIPEYNEFTGVVIRDHKSIGPHQIGLYTGNTKFPMRVIDLDRIVGMEDSLPVPNVSVKTYSIQGSKGNAYTVVHNKSAWSCDCPGYQFRRSCKHVDKIKSVVA